MTALRRRAGALAVIVAVGTAGLLGSLGELHPLAAVAGLELSPDPTVPYALSRPLWTDVPRTSAAEVTPASRGAARARAGLRIIAREQRSGVLRGVLGRRPARLVQLGPLQDRGRPIGVTALLALPVARHGVRATVPVPGAGRVRFMAPVLRDVLVDLDLRRGAVVGVEPGPASRTSSWTEASPPTPAAAAAAVASTPPALVRLSPHGPSFASYDGTKALGRAGRDWPVSLVFTGHATVGKVKRALRAAGFTHRGERRWLAYGAPGGAVRFDGDRGLKTVQDPNGTDVHVRLYAPPRTDHFTDPRFGSVVVATAHLDRGEGSATPPRVYGFSEEAARRVADALAGRLGWRVQRDAIALGNAEPYRRDLAVPDHVWWSDGRATLIRVP